jgi:hypothetical protein
MQTMSEEQRRRGYQGFHCTCNACRDLSDEERAAKQERIRQARRRGGKARAVQESMTEARSKGFWRTMELHPFFARKHLRRKIKAQNQHRMIRKTLVPRPARPRRRLPPEQRPPLW